MMVRLFQIVLTRFNLRTSVTGGRDVTDEDWLHRRLTLFETFCLPSMQAQSAPHDWLVWFDSETPSAVKRRIETHRGFTPMYVEGTLDHETLISRIAGRVPAEATHLLTTRLDNDDGIASSFLARLQSVAGAADRDLFLNFPLGYQWRDGRLYYSYQSANPFLSYVERLAAQSRDRGILSVAHGNHDSVVKNGQLRQIWTPPMWLQVLHESNVANELKGVRRLAGGPPLGFVNVPLAHDSVGDRWSDVARSAANLGSLPWRKRHQLWRRVAVRAHVDRGSD